ncbi:MAG: HAMP domain-containing protein [Nitrospinota bacterium]|nr:MAG: HAMP domain-containing protein [Nitrospinota bacterium]
MIRFRLQTKLFLLVSALVLVLILSTLLVVNLWVTRQMYRNVESDLQGAQSVFAEFQRTRYASLLAICRLLGKDFALRTAVATYDPGTVLSAAMTFQARVNSQLFLITDAAGRVLARTDRPEIAGEDVSGLPAIRAALQGKESTTNWVLMETLYQVATVPLKAGSDILGTLSIGFLIDDAVTRELKKATRSEITFLTFSRAVASTWQEQGKRTLAHLLLSGQPQGEKGEELRLITVHGEDYLSLIAPIRGSRNEPLGLYVLQRSVDEALGFLRTLQKALILIGASGVGIALIISFVMARSITAPVQKLVAGTTAVSAGNYDLRIVVRSQDEIGILADSYNRMAQALQEKTEALQAAYEDLRQKNVELESTLQKVRLLENIKTHLGKFVPEAVKRIIETTPEAPDLEKHDRDVSVLFLDIAGYTHLSETIDLEKVNYLVEHYFSSFLDDIYRHNGDINETAGDGLMIIFQDGDRRRHALNAVQTAVAIQQKVASINQSLQGRYQPLLVNIGINSGSAAVGSTRFEGITGTRWTFTASGPVTNIAARLGELATQGEILIGEETARRVQGVVPVREIGKHHLKNVSEPVTVYRVEVAVSAQPLR